MRMLPVIHGFWLGYVRTYGHCGDDAVDALIDEADKLRWYTPQWYTPQLNESRNIFQSALVKQSCSVASESSDHFRIERVTGTSYFSFCL
jgi:hypothetical protein